MYRYSDAYTVVVVDITHLQRKRDQILFIFFFLEQLILGTYSAESFLFLKGACQYTSDEFFFPYFLNFEWRYFQSVINMPVFCVTYDKQRFQCYFIWLLFCYMKILYVLSTPYHTTIPAEITTIYMLMQHKKTHKNHIQDKNINTTNKMKWI